MSFILLYKHFELQKKVLLFFAHYATFPIFVRRKLTCQFNLLAKHIPFTRMKNRCVISERSNAVFSFFNLSRILVVNLAKLKFIPFLVKSS
jgi:ribosomal protein S14